ncbi:MAG: aldehyde dehydrogenase [Deltaproteobacteria bacterium RIFOXYA12_FULL_58_15]|nr:MAG: aldehyde dehydrogenase [Deltaproteobacteria bacterium RIFOXYA12_FULL_58_15]OGR12258.1 MAG: aldehyde dehydrogenase [Deltaproteobacteria bacterium RIFOXYB12_FULL_58_9]
MAKIQKTVSPIDGSVYVERPLADAPAIDATLRKSSIAQREWRCVSMAERKRLAHAFVDAMLTNTDAIVQELAWQMGRPVRYGPGELRGFAERGRYMIDIAEESLADLAIADKPGFTRFIRREPLGVVFVVAPWNYPFLTAVNAVVPALMAGNSVILKHSAQTPLVAERFTEAGEKAGLPPGLLQHLDLSHDGVAQVIGDERTGHVAFTGSVEGGRAITRAAAGRFIAAGLELGGKDPAYVRPDANIAQAVEMLVDGSFFNTGQSCCGIERIYVHGDVYDKFVEGFVETTRLYVVGNPLEQETTLGPVVRESAAAFIRGQIKAAVDAGARALIDEGKFAKVKEGTTYMAPQVLVDVDHSMDVMTEETFGPVVGIMKVDSDERAIELMNDSQYGLTAVVCTADVDAAVAIGDQVETGTWFLNRCDYLDPALAWTGVKNTGRGCTLSQVGYEHLTRPKSFHLKTAG